ncbi:hypothetical protein GCM10023199_31900 [Actinomycetospora chibensis]
MNGLRHRSRAPDGRGGLPGGPAAEPPFGSPPYGVPPSSAPGSSGRSPHPYGPASFVPPQRTARSGGPCPGTVPYPVPYPVLYPAPAARRARRGRGLPIAVIAGLTALVLAGVVTLVVLIFHAAPGAAPGTAGERRVITTHVGDGRAVTVDIDIDTQAQGDTVSAAIWFRPSPQ